MIRNRKVQEPIVAITKGMSEGKSLEKALDLLPMDKIIQKGDKVIITPNWVKNKNPKDGVVVGPKTLQKLIQTTFYNVIWYKKRLIENSKR